MLYLCNITSQFLYCSIFRIHRQIAYHVYLACRPQNLNGIFRSSFQWDVISVPWILIAYIFSQIYIQQNGKLHTVVTNVYALVVHHLTVLRHWKNCLVLNIMLCVVGFLIKIKISDFYWLKITSQRHYFRSQYIGYASAFLFCKETYQNPNLIGGV